MYRLTLDEATRVLTAARGTRERRAIFSASAPAFATRSFEAFKGGPSSARTGSGSRTTSPRAGASGGVPVIADLESVVDEIRQNVAADEYVLPSQRWRDPGFCTSWIDFSKRPCSAQALYGLVGRVGERAGISARVYPHLLRRSHRPPRRHQDRAVPARSRRRRNDGNVRRQTNARRARARRRRLHVRRARTRVLPLRDTSREAAYSP
jgi:hypothetical protein